MHTLTGIAFSPWTHKARWALEHANFPFKYSEYLPTLGEPQLRLALGKWRGVVSVPVLFPEQGKPIEGGLNIARFAEHELGSHPLGDLHQAAEWDEFANRGMSEGRIRMMRRVLADDVAVKEQQRGIIPGPLQEVFAPMTRAILERTISKYNQLSQTGAMRELLQRARAQLARSGGSYLLGSFSYADIAVASALELVKPIARFHSAHIPHLTAAWTWPELASEFEDLIAWRMRLLNSGVTRFSMYRA